VADPGTGSPQLVISFGPFRLLPAQQLLLEDDAPVRLGSRALEILAALVEHAGEVVAKNELLARVWPNTFVDENTLRVHVAGLRRALGDGQPGRRYLASVPGRGYRFVAPVKLTEPERPLPYARLPVPANNLPLSKPRAVGRAGVIGALSDQLRRHRLITIVGAGGIGKTTVALALAETFLPAYEDGVRFVDLAPVEDPQFVPSALGATLELAIHPENLMSGLAGFLKDKQMLIVLDSCEHVIGASALLAEQLLAAAPGIHILATSREPLRAEGERVHRLLPLDFPADSTGITAAKALTFPAVQLFVERASAILDEFELSDADAPVVSDICRRLDGIALAIELAAARVDAFGVQQLDDLLDDRFHILSKGKRTAQPRHRSLAAALDWSYAFLPEAERQVLKRLSVFVGSFTLDCAIAVAGDSDTDVIESIANLVAKSLLSAETGGTVVRYRLLDSTRAYAAQKLDENGELETYSKRHALHHLHWLERAEAEWDTREIPEWLEEYGRKLDDVRAALNWAFSSGGDTSIGIALTLGAIPLWFQLSLLHECRERLEGALASLSARPDHDEADELRLLIALGMILPHAMRSLPGSSDLWAKTLALAEKLEDLAAQGQTLYHWSTYCLYAGKFRESLAAAERCRAIAGKTGSLLFEIMGCGMIGLALHHLGDPEQAQRYVNLVLEQDVAPNQRALFSNQLTVRSTYSAILWTRGLPDQAARNARQVIQETMQRENPLMLSDALGRAACWIAIDTGDLTEAERLVETLLDCSAKSGLNPWNALGRCLKGRLLVIQGDLAGLEVQRNALDWLRDANFFFLYPISLGALAEGLGAAGRLEEGLRAIDEALERARLSEDRWCQPELLRIKGEILGSMEADESAEEHFQLALDQAHRQGALSWELRAAIGLAKLWRTGGRTTEAKNLLSAVHDRFTEGFDTADLRAARALLAELD
jgi:predicted ATPase/DNA-binding winged helix-turn-helix (wHTH) protein